MDAPNAAFSQCDHDGFDGLLDGLLVLGDRVTPHREAFQLTHDFLPLPLRGGLIGGRLACLPECRRLSMTCHLAAAGRLDEPVEDASFRLLVGVQYFVVLAPHRVDDFLLLVDAQCSSIAVFSSAGVVRIRCNCRSKPDCKAAVRLERRLEQLLVRVVLAPSADDLKQVDILLVAWGAGWKAIARWSGSSS